MAVQYGPLVVRKIFTEKRLRLQKRATRIFLYVDKTATSVHLFNTINWIPFYAESYVNRCTLSEKRLNGNTPVYINDLLIKNSDIHDKITGYCNLNDNDIHTYI